MMTKLKQAEQERDALAELVRELEEHCKLLEIHKGPCEETIYARIGQSEWFDKLTKLLKEADGE